MRAIRRPTRRAVLLAGAVGVPMLAGCAAPVVTTREAERDPVRRENLGDELTLIASYRAALTARPDLATTLTPILAAHEDHARALAAGLPDPTSAMPSAAPSEGTDVVATLREAERAGLTMRTSSVNRASEGDLAALLSWISSSEAQHVALLGMLP